MIKIGVANYAGFCLVGHIIAIVSLISALLIENANLQDDPIKGGHDGLWEGVRRFKCLNGHGVYLPFAMIIKDPLFLPDTLPINLNDLTSTVTTSATPGLNRSASDSAANTTTTRQTSSEKSDKPLAEEVLDELLNLTTDPGADGMFY